MYLLLSWLWCCDGNVFGRMRLQLLLHWLRYPTAPSPCDCVALTLNCGWCTEKPVAVPLGPAYR